MKNKKGQKRKKEDVNWFLESDTGVAHRRFYMDSSEYVEGIKDERGADIIRPLSTEEKNFLDKFNSEFYGAKFDKNDNKNLHKFRATISKIKRIKSSIMYYKRKVKKLKDYNKASSIYSKIKELTEELLKLNPKKSCTDANNSRNRCIMNRHKNIGSIIPNAPDVNEDTYFDAIKGILDSVDDQED